MKYKISTEYFLIVTEILTFIFKFTYNHGDHRQKNNRICFDNQMDSKSKQYNIGKWSLNL